MVGHDDYIVANDFIYRGYIFLEFHVERSSSWKGSYPVRSDNRGLIPLDSVTKKYLLFALHFVYSFQHKLIAGRHDLMEIGVFAVNGSMINV